MAAYRAGNAADADQRFSDAYFAAYESSGLEIAVRQFVSAKRNYQFEKMFGELRRLVAAQAPTTALEAKTWELKHALREDVAKLRGRGKSELFGGETSSGSSGPAESGASGAFVQSLLIILREGFEAILLLAALAAYVGRSGGPSDVRVLWLSAAAAVAASILTAIGFNKALAVSPARREVMEGLTMLLASAVLFYVSYWLISKSESRRWQSYIKGKVGAAVGGRRLFALGSVAFLAVYREGAETVLFYQALSASMAGARGQILSGLAAGSALLLVLFLLFRRAIGKLPAGPFFTVTSGFLYLLAFVFAGKGVHELQEGRLVGQTPVPFAPHIDLLGIFPSAEGVTVQVLFVIALAFVALRLARRARAADVSNPTLA